MAWALGPKPFSGHLSGDVGAKPIFAKRLHFLHGMLLACLRKQNGSVSAKIKKMVQNHQIRFREPQNDDFEKKLDYPNWS